MQKRMTITVVRCATLAFVLSVWFAGSAHAAWFIGGSELKTSAALASSSSSEGGILLTVPSILVTVACSGSLVSGTGQEINSGNVIKAKSLAFNGCETIEPETDCELAGEPALIITQPLTGTVTLGTTKSEDRIKFVAQTKNLLATVSFAETNTCVFNGEEPIKGSVTLAAPTDQSEEVVQDAEGLGSVENNSLEVGSGNKAYLEGCSLALELADRSKWSYR